MGKLPVTLRVKMRVSELVSLKVSSRTGADPRLLLNHGKGSKERW